MRSCATHLLFSLLIGAAAFCAQPALASPETSSQPAVSDTAGTPAQDEAGYTESGQATWYGPRHEGQRTTSGETFDSSKLTAAHSSLPLGSFVRVTMSRTGRSIVVRVNDREPPHGVRCIDLSRAAAARLGFIGQGVADVTLAQVSPEEATEVAEAPETGAGSAAPRAVRVSARHGRRHTHHGHR